MAHRLTTCTFYGVGCGLYLETSGNTVIGVSPSISHPSAKALKRAYEAMPAPKLVFAIAASATEAEGCGTTRTP